MKVTITLRGTLKKYFGEDKERVYEVPEGCTCDEALQIAGNESLSSDMRATSIDFIALRNPEVNASFLKKMTVLYYI